jgi:hypothetical protein
MREVHHAVLRRESRGLRRIDRFELADGGVRNCRHPRARRGDADPRASRFGWHIERDVDLNQLAANLQAAVRQNRVRPWLRALLG